MAENKYEPIIGIDLGTTKSAVSVYVDGRPKIIPNHEGYLTTPSVVGFTDDGKILVGDVALRQASLNPMNTVYAIKQYVGRSYQDICKIARKMPFILALGPYQDVCILVDKKGVSPTQIIAEILKYLKECAEEFLQQKVKYAVVGVPVDSNEYFRQAIRDAGEMAGLYLLRVCDEVSSVILGINESLRGDQEKFISIINFGGGSFEISIVEVGSDLAVVKSTRGDSQLGGEIIDLLIVKWMAEEFNKLYDVDIYKEPAALHMFKDAAVKAKLELSSSIISHINIPYLFAGDSVYNNFNIILTRSKFVELIGDILSKINTLCELALKEASISADIMDYVILNGGSSRITEFKKNMANIFKKNPYGKNNPDLSVVEGLAVYGVILSGDVKNFLLLDAVQYSLGVETCGENKYTEIIQRNELIPVRRSKIFTTTTDNQKNAYINIIQSEYNSVEKGVSIAKLVFEDIPKMPRGKPKIEITIDIQINGIMQLTVGSLDTGKKKNVQIIASQENLNKEMLIKDEGISPI